MKVSDEAVAEFRRLYREEYGEELTDAEANEMTFRLITLYELLMRKRPQEQIAILEPSDGSAEQTRKFGFL